MTAKRMLGTYAITMAVISLPFVVIHLMARPDDAPITPLQHITAAVANFFGPWGVSIVRLVDFPNAGMRSFSWVLAVTLTLLGVLLVVLGTRVNRLPVQLLLAACWALFVFFWFGIGLTQIADGLL